MIAHKQLNSKGENKKGENVVSYLLKTEVLNFRYYKGDEIAMMVYGGKGAAALGLLGQEVKEAEMLALTQGFHPSTGEPLCQNAGTDKHKVGYDFVFTPGKDVSILFGLGDTEQKMDALDSHRRAVKKAMEYFESVAETRFGAGGKDVEGVKGLVYSHHTHTSSRNLDPNLHDHVLIYNVAERKDGSWGTFDAKELYRNIRAADAIYQNELACNMREKGYGIRQFEETQITGEVVRRFGIRGIGEELCQAFSTRRAEILEHVAKFGGDTQTACLATRKDKEEPSQEEQRVMWEKVAQSLGPDLADLSKIKELQGDIRLPDTGLADLHRKLHENEAIVCQHDLIKTIGIENMGFMRTEQIFSAVEEFKQSLMTVDAKRIHKDDQGKTLAREYSEVRYQSPAMRETELGIIKGALRRQDETRLRLRPESTEKAIAKYEEINGFQLSPEQIRAVKHITNETAGVAILEGYAGTGKTTVSQAVKRSFEEEGYSLVGVAISNAAAKKLHEESGMPCASVALTLSRLDKGKMTLTDKTVLVVDEAGMLDARFTERLMTHAEKAGAKIILQGDENQLQPICAGSGFKLAKASIGAEKLTEIRRQKTVDMQATALSFYDKDEHDGPKSRMEQVRKGKRIMENLEESTFAFSGHFDATKQCVKDFMEDPLPMDEKLLIAHTREDIRALTSGVREALRTKGDLLGDDFTVKCRQGKGFEERSFAEGDRVRFKARDLSLGVINGTEGVIRGIRRNRFDEGIDFIIESEGHTLKFSSHEYNALDHNYAVTVHASQGQGKEHVYHLYNQGMADNQSLLVGFTRTKAKYQIYGEEEELGSAYTRAGMDRKKENALTQESEAFKLVREEVRQGQIR